MTLWRAEYPAALAGSSSTVFESGVVSNGPRVSRLIYVKLIPSTGQATHRRADQQREQEAMVYNVSLIVRLAEACRRW